MQQTNQSDPAMFWVIFGAVSLVIVAIIFFGWRQKKARTAESWSGVVSDKDEREFIQESRNNNNDNGQNNSGININLSGNNNSHKITKHFMTFKKDDGTSVEWEVSDGLYQSLNIGDKVIKNSGEYNPTKN